MDDEKMNQDEAATFLGMRPKTLEIWRQRGIGPVFEKRPNGRVFYRVEDLRAWQKERTEKKEQAA